MGTSCLVNVYKERAGAIIVSIYCVGGGAPEGVGCEIREIVGERILLKNGFQGLEDEHQFNGMLEFAAYLVRDMKIGSGNVYLRPPEPNNPTCNYLYELYPVETRIHMRITANQVRNFSIPATYEDVVEYDGPVHEFKPWWLLKKEAEEEA